MYPFPRAVGWNIIWVTPEDPQQTDRPAFPGRLCNKHKALK